jgi:hypothetical protein
MFRFADHPLPTNVDENPDGDPTLTDSSREFSRRRCSQTTRRKFLNGAKRLSEGLIAIWNRALLRRFCNRMILQGLVALAGVEPGFAAILFSISYIRLYKRPEIPANTPNLELAV